MSALYAWLRRHPRLVDGVLAAALAFSGLAVGIANARPFLLGATLAMTIPVIFRRQHPELAFGIAIATGAAQVVADTNIVPSDLAIVVLLYTLAAYTTRRKSVIGLAICLIGSAVKIWQVQLPAAAISRPDWLVVGAMMFGGPSLLAWVLGDSMRYRRAYYANLEERAARLERDRDEQSRIAATAERARIARELHDVVAHNVSVMVVQADGAAYALDTDPGRVRDALAAISATGRQALTEMRVLLGVLRTTAVGDAACAGPGAAGGSGEAALAPLPGLSQLDDLLDQARAAGLPVSYTIDGDPRALPDGTALAAYRIIQESLTNARKHAGTGASADVLLRYARDAVEITITDDGIGCAAPCDGAGHGLTGMSERAAMYGGSVLAGPAPDGGFRVVALLPTQMTRATQAAQPARAGAA